MQGFFYTPHKNNQPNKKPFGIRSLADIGSHT